MRTSLLSVVLPWLLLAAACSGGDRQSSSQPSPLVVNSLADIAAPPAGTVTLRSALASAASGQRITFDPQLDGGTIELTQVDAEHTTLKGEVMGIRDEPSGPVSYLIGWFDRDYGRSALYARKDVVIDASGLRSGITLRWAGGEQPGARVLAVYGDLTLTNVTITGGRSVTEAIPETGTYPQPWTLARGGAVAVWGVARLTDCRFHDNSVTGDFEASRDRGAFGGAVYADLVAMENCMVSGNAVLGGGAAGGGVYSVGGAGHSGTTSTILRSAITGNRISGLFVYGGGVYSDGGGIGNRKTMMLTNSTIARNLAEPAPGLPPFLLGSGYWRGAGVYMSNGFLEIRASTIVENEVHGVLRTDSLGRRNLAGGIAATVGNAHATEHMIIGRSIVAGNTVTPAGGTSYAHDVFTGSLFYFRSAGHNRIGVIDFSQMLAPVGEWDWQSLSRKHFPQVGDEHGVQIVDVLDLTNGISHADSIVSVGADAGEPAVLHYQPRGTALAQVPASTYTVPETLAQYRVDSGGDDNFLAIVLDRLESHYSLAGFASQFTADFETFLQTVDTNAAIEGRQPYENPAGQPILTLADTHFFGPAQTWPQELENHPYIEFWHRLDATLASHAIPDMGPEVMGDTTWASLFSSGPLAENARITISVDTRPRLSVQPLLIDQVGTSRSSTGLSDIGAIETP